ncbi:hypothetical protein HOF65_08695 [bacterium]|jgi:hypothetical protein|nr:hypothetical protein [bacterium]MBT4632602.1 hypothetical protein [bacterium]MBT5491359.1 hypothetical protein [bacterium]MBT6779454.1 hypothetical protein [bacterium]
MNNHHICLIVARFNSLLTKDVNKTSGNEQQARVIATNSLELLKLDFIRENYGTLTTSELNQITEKALSDSLKKDLRVVIDFNTGFRTGIPHNVGPINIAGYPDIE